MTEGRLRFDGRVAVVTGAGRGIGRAYALLLAERGASVVVNDLGGSIGGGGRDEGPAAGVVSEIEGRGGRALADTSDISTAGGARSVVEAAVGTFGRIDALVNNAGIIRWAGPPDVDGTNLSDHLAVHTIGSFNTALAAWPHMAGQGYGRILMTTSSGVFGLAGNTSYATAKAGVIGLTRSLAVAGNKLGIKVNLIAPAALTRMADSNDGPAMPAEEVAPMAAFLVHEDCPVSGEMYAAGAGRFARMFIASTPGWVHEGGGTTIEDVAGHWPEINDEAGYWIPRHLMGWSARFLSHLQAGS